MSLNTPLILKGKYFSLYSKFSKDSEGSYVITDNPKIYRGVLDIDYPFYIDCNQFRTEFAKSRINDISYRLGSNIGYLQLEFWGLKYLGSNGNYKEHKIESHRLIELIDKLNKDKHINIDRYKFSMLHLPYILAPLEENKLLSDLINHIIMEADLPLDNLDTLVLSGEMIWSRFINSFILINLLNELKLKRIYLIVDQGGIWQGLINIKELSELKLINKKYLMPGILFQTVSSYSKDLFIKNEDNKRKLYLINDLNVIDLGTRQFYMNDLLIPRYLIIKKNLKDNKKKDFIHISTDILKQGRGVFKIIPQNTVGTIDREANLGNVNMADCRKKVGDWVNVNETIGKKIISRYDTYKLGKDDKIKVFEGQIVKRGDGLFNKGLISEVKVKNAGRVDLSLKGKNILRVILEESESSLLSPFNGEFRGAVNSSGIRVKSSFSYFKLFQSIGEGAWGVLSYESGSDSNIVLCDDLDEANKYIKGDPIDSIYFTNQIKGLLIKKISFSELIKLKSIKIPNFNVGIISIENELYLDLWKSLEKDLLNNFVLIQKDNLFFQLNKSFSDQYIFKQDELLDYDLKLGDKVNFIDLKTSDLYGKIIKSKSKSQKSFIINNKEGLFNISIRNIIKFKNGE